VSLANSRELRQAKLCGKCSKPLGKERTIVDKTGKYHTNCWKEWAMNDPDYQSQLAIYKADPHPQYYMLDPADLDKPFDPADAIMLVIQ
jgi:hypothetical protein